MAGVAVVVCTVVAPWVTLELDDGDELAVMAVQRADGQVAREEALRLARIVDRHWNARA
jgi:hypothetical protein